MTSTSWTRSAFEAAMARLGTGPVGVGLGLAALGCLLFAVQELVLGRAPLVSDPDVRGPMVVALTHVLIVSYLFTAYVIAERTTERTIASLGPLLERGAGAAAGRTRGERIVLDLCSVASVGVGALLAAELSPGVVTWDPSDWTPEIAWHRVLGFGIGFGVGRLSALLVIESRRLSGLAGRLRDIDLLDLSPLAPFARQGLTNALLVIGVVTAFGLFLVDLAYLGLFAAILVATLAVAAFALLLPMRGLRERIATAKREELARCRARIRAARAALEAGQDGPSTRLADWVAWERRVEAVREWPLDTSTLLRLVAYLLIPLGSWAGGALVERVIDALLD